MQSKSDAYHQLSDENHKLMDQFVMLQQNMIDQMGMVPKSDDHGMDDTTASHSNSSAKHEDDEPQRKKKKKAKTETTDDEEMKFQQLNSQLEMEEMQMREQMKASNMVAEAII